MHREPNGHPTGILRTSYGHPTDKEPDGHSLQTSEEPDTTDKEPDRTRNRASYGHPTDILRTSYGHPTDILRTSYGHPTDKEPDMTGHEGTTPLWSFLGPQGISTAICTCVFFSDVASGRRFGIKGPGCCYRY